MISEVQQGLRSAKLMHAKSPLNHIFLIVVIVDGWKIYLWKDIYGITMYYLDFSWGLHTRWCRHPNAGYIQRHHALIFAVYDPIIIRTIKYMLKAILCKNRIWDQFFLHFFLFFFSFSFLLLLFFASSFFSFSFFFS